MVARASPVRDWISVLNFGSEIEARQEEGRKKGSAMTLAFGCGASGKSTLPLEGEKKKTWASAQIFTGLRLIEGISLLQR